MAAHRYWRLLFTAGDQPGGIDVSEVVFKSGGTDITVNGTPNASSYYTWDVYALNPAQAFDKSVLSDWATAAGATYPHWLSYDFVGAVNVDSFSITSSGSPGTGGNAGGNPTGFALQWSDDNTAWQSLQTYSTTWPTGQTTQNFPVNAVPIVDSMTKAPASAPANTPYTVTIVAHDPNNPPVSLSSATLVRSDGGVVTPVGGQPAGTFKWTTTI